MLTKQDGFNPMEGFPVQQRQYMDPGINGNTRVLESLYRHSRGTVNAAYAPSTQPALLSATSPYMYPAQPRPPPLDRSQAAFSQQPYYDLMNSPPPLRRDAQIMAHRGTPVPASPMPVYATGPHTPAPDGTLRNPAMSMINGMPAMAQYMGMASNGLFTPPPNSTSPIGASFPGFASPNPQFYSPPSNFNGNDGLVNAMGRLAISPSFSATPSPYSDAASNSSSVQNQSGPSANNRKLGLYKTELCRSWEEKGTCRYGAKCQFAHSEGEVRRVSRHPKVSSSATACHQDSQVPSIRQKFAEPSGFPDRARMASGAVSYIPNCPRVVRHLAPMVPLLPNSMAGFLSIHLVPLLETVTAQLAMQVAPMCNPFPSCKGYLHNSAKTLLRDPCPPIRSHLAIIISQSLGSYGLTPPWFRERPITPSQVTRP